MTSESIKEIIRRKREEKRFTQHEMAEKLGISRTSYRNIEEGSTRLFCDKLQDIAEILETSIEELLTGQNTSDISGQLLKEENNCREKLKTLTDYYEERIRNLNETLSIKDNAIRTQNDIINRLNAQIDRLCKEK